MAIAVHWEFLARLNPDNKVMEYWVKDQFVSVLKQQEGGAVLTLKKEADAVWNYYQNWTMGRLVGNEYVSLNLTGRSWDGDTLELALIPGTISDYYHQPPFLTETICMGENIYDKRRRTERRNLASPRSSAWGYAGAYFPSGV